MLPWVFPNAAATVTPGNLDGLALPEQWVHDSSSAVPVFGFSMISDGSDALLNINVSFYGSYFWTGNNYTLYTLNHDSSISGVGLYRDDGSRDDVLDSLDTPVDLDDIGWGGNTVYMDLTGQGEAIPAAATGNYTWFIVIRTGKDTTYFYDGQYFYGYFGSNTIVATDGTGVATMPASPVQTSNMYERQTYAVNLITGSNNYLGQPSVEVHEVAFLGYRIGDGMSTANSGVDDRLMSLDLRLRQRAGSVSALDFRPLDPDSARSGIGFYMDNGNVDDQWDTSDTPVTFGSISPTDFGVGGVTMHMTFSPAPALPAAPNGTFDFFFVARSEGLVSGDAFDFQVVPGSVIVDGILPSDRGRMVQVYNYSSSRIYGDDTPPQVQELYWGSISSPYVAVIDDTRLYFNHEMTAPVCATAFAYVYDGNSGLKNFTFSDEPSLQGSPAQVRQNISGSGVTVSTFYEFRSTTDESSSPIDGWVYDRVGNMASAVGDGHNVTYQFEPEWIIIDPDESYWCDWWNGGTYVDDDGTLWFSDQISGTSYGELCIRALSLYGGGVANISFSNEPQLMTPDNPYQTWGPGYSVAYGDLTYGFWSNSTQGDGQVTVTVEDHDGQSETMNFPYREDNTPPVITITSPADLSNLNGIVRLRATVTDAGSGLSDVWWEQRPDWYDNNMYNDNGDSWFYDMVTTQFEDGPNRIMVHAEDYVGNEAVAYIDVVVTSSTIDIVAPTVGIVSPLSGAALMGHTLIQVDADDPAGVTGVWVQVDSGPWQQLSLNATSLVYDFDWNTAGYADGTHTMTARATDRWGNSADTPVLTVKVDNTAPVAQVSFPGASQTLAGTIVIQVYAHDEVGIKSVNLKLDGETVQMALNPASGYYEYTLDTRRWSDGEHTMSTTVVDAQGSSMTSPTTTVQVRNSDTIRAVASFSSFLIFLVVLAALVVGLFLMRAGVIRKWMSGAGGGGGSGGGSSGSSMGGSSSTTAPAGAWKDEEKKP